MKFRLNFLVAIFAVMTLVFTSCENDDPVDMMEGNGALVLEFDNVFGDANLAAETNYIVNGESINVTKAKYIVSNIVLTKSDGTTFTYPKSDSYFIIDEFLDGGTEIHLENIPAGNYTGVTFGIGVDQTQFEAGADGQGNFLAKAQDAGMMWTWAAGYKFLALEGNYTSSTVTTAAQYKIHVGKTGTAYNYAEVNLTFPNNALIRTSITPQVHLIANLAKVINSTNQITLSEGATIMGGDKLSLIATNIATMFSVDHVHND